MIRNADSECRFTKPGGWVEFQDFDMRFYTTSGEFQPGCPLDQWTNEVIEGVKVFGMEPEPGPKLEGWVRDAGFKNVHHQVLPLPVGVWPKSKKMVSTPLPSPTPPCLYPLEQQPLTKLLAGFIEGDRSTRLSSVP